MLDGYIDFTMKVLQAVGSENLSRAVNRFAAHPVMGNLVLDMVVEMPPLKRTMRSKVKMVGCHLQTPQEFRHIPGP